MVLLQSKQVWNQVGKDLSCASHLYHKVYLLLNIDYSENKITWAVKVVKFTGWIGIGICLKNIISKANFFFNYSNIGHGSYMISNNGYSWSHSAS
jgi:hypothetical protein